MLPSSCDRGSGGVLCQSLAIALVILFLCQYRMSYGQGLQGTLDKLPSQKGCEGSVATLNVTSERMLSDSKAHTFVFEEKVRVIRCAMTITCDRLQVINEASEKNIERIVATGNVRFQQGNRSASADRADYFEIEQKLILTGNPRVWDTQGQDELAGEEIVLLLQEEKVLVKQARVLFHPRKTPLKTP